MIGMFRTESRQGWMGNLALDLSDGRGKRGTIGERYGRTKGLPSQAKSRVLGYTRGCTAEKERGWKDKTASVHTSIRKQKRQKYIPGSNPRA